MKSKLVSQDKTITIFGLRVGVTFSKKTRDVEWEETGGRWEAHKVF